MNKSLKFVIFAIIITIAIKMQARDFELRTEYFNYIDVGELSKPSITDLDGNGLLVLIIGESEGKLRHYKVGFRIAFSFNVEI